MRLSELLSDHRVVKGMSIRKLAKAIGIDHTALFRFEQGGTMDGENLLKLLVWLLSEGK